MDKSERENMKQNEKFKKQTIKINERPDLFNFLYSKFFFISEFKFNISDNNDQFKNKSNLEISTHFESEKNLYRSFFDISDEFKQFVNDNLLKTDDNRIEICFETNYNQNYVFYGYYSHSISFHLLINIFMCLKQKKFVFEFIAFPAFEVFFSNIKNAILFKSIGLII